MAASAGLLAGPEGLHNPLMKTVALEIVVVGMSRLSGPAQVFAGSDVPVAAWLQDLTSHALEMVVEGMSRLSGPAQVSVGSAVSGAAWLEDLTSDDYDTGRR
jgi:hypothetical protein